MHLRANCDCLNIQSNHEVQSQDEIQKLNEIIDQHWTERSRYWDEMKWTLFWLNWAFQKSYWSSTKPHQAGLIIFLHQKDRWRWWTCSVSWMLFWKTNWRFQTDVWSTRIVVLTKNWSLKRELNFQKRADVPKTIYPRFECSIDCKDDTDEAWWVEDDRRRSRRGRSITNATTDRRSPIRRSPIRRR